MAIWIRGRRRRISFGDESTVGIGYDTHPQRDHDIIVISTYELSRLTSRLRDHQRPCTIELYIHTELAPGKHEGSKGKAPASSYAPGGKREHGHLEE